MGATGQGDSMKQAVAREQDMDERIQAALADTQRIQREVNRLNDEQRGFLSSFRVERSVFRGFLSA